MEDDLIYIVYRKRDLKRLYLMLMEMSLMIVQLMNLGKIYENVSSIRVLHDVFLAFLLVERRSLHKLWHIIYVNYPRLQPQAANAADKSCKSRLLFTLADKVRRLQMPVIKVANESI